MTLSGTVLKTYDSNAVIYNKKRFILVTDIDRSVLPGDNVTIRGAYYKKHYLRHDFTDGYIDAFKSEYIRVK